MPLVFWILCDSEVTSKTTWRVLSAFCWRRLCAMVFIPHKEKSLTFPCILRRSNYLLTEMLFIENVILWQCLWMILSKITALLIGTLSTFMSCLGSCIVNINKHCRLGNYIKRHGWGSVSNKSCVKMVKLTIRVT